MAKKNRKPHAASKAHLEPIRREDHALKPAPAPLSASIPSAEIVTGGVRRKRWWQLATSNAQDFLGFRGGDATYLWPRWLVLRAVGFLFVVAFVGVLREGRALLAPQGIMPLDVYFAELGRLFPGSVRAFLAAPSLFWFGRSAGFVDLLGWVGLVSGVALMLNLWPRLALFVCWLCFLSFVTTWGEFSPAQIDALLLELAVLAIPFAPRGIRPGLGAHAPPRPIAVFMMRWLLLRVTFGSAVVKLFSDDPHWANLTAMDVMYETSPSPTVFGYWIHQLPHAYHVFEIGFTFVAEFVGPLLAVFAGRRGRWSALGAWILLQIGIQLTCNFGWLNTAAIGLGVLFLDDQMLRSASAKLRIGTWAEVFSRASSAPVLPVAGSIPWWRLHGLRAALGVHLALTLYFSAQACNVRVDAAPAPIVAMAKFFGEFRSANGYSLYARFAAAHDQVDFEGSNDGGKTWRIYPYRYVPQLPNRMPPWHAPFFGRFDTTLQIISSKADSSSPTVPLIAAHLLAGNEPVVGLFRNNPFPESPPRAVRMRLYRLAFTDRETFRRTGNYWTKFFVRDYVPTMYLRENGSVAQFSLEAGDAAMKAGNYAAAFSSYLQQYRAGNTDAAYRLAELYSQGLGTPAQPEKVVALFSELAERGEIKAIHNLGLCYEHGVGVAVDYPKATAFYRKAAQAGNLASLFALGTLSATNKALPPNDIEGLASLLRAAAAAKGSDQIEVRIRSDEPALRRMLTERMSPAEVAQAHAMAEVSRSR